MTGEWIDASVELPPEMDDESSDDVLVTAGDGTCAVLYFDHREELWLDRWGFVFRDEVTHWMKLPEPPPFSPLRAA